MKMPMLCFHEVRINEAKQGRVKLLKGKQKQQNHGETIFQVMIQNFITNYESLFGILPM